MVLRRLDFVPVSRPSESAASEEQAYLGSRHFCSGPEGDSHRFLNTSIVYFSVVVDSGWSSLQHLAAKSLASGSISLLEIATN